MSENVSKYEILQQFAMKNPEQVKNYLTEFPELESVLGEAYQQIQTVFTNEALELKVVVDHEFPELTSLFIHIWTQLDVDVALERLHQLEDNWYLELPFFIRERISINVKFK